MGLPWIFWPGLLENLTELTEKLSRCTCSGGLERGTTIQNQLPDNTYANHQSVSSCTIIMITIHVASFNHSLNVATIVAIPTI